MWSIKHNIFGVQVSVTTYEEALALIVRTAKRGVPATIDHMPVHGLIEAMANSHWPLASRPAKFSVFYPVSGSSIHSCYLKHGSIPEKI